MPIRNTPPTREDRCDRDAGVAKARSGSATRTPADAIEEHRTGAPKSQVAPGAKMPPKASPKTHTSEAPARRWPAPPRRDQRPRGATSSQMPSPSWIQTVAAAAWIGWLDQMVTPLLTTCCTHCGDVLAAGWITSGREPQGHGRLQLQQSVEDPEAAEADAHDPPGQRLGHRGRDGRGNASALCP